MADKFVDLCYELGNVAYDHHTNTLSFAVYIYVDPSLGVQPTAFVHAHILNSPSDRSDKETDGTVTATTMLPGFNYVANFSFAAPEGINAFTLHVMASKPGYKINGHLCDKIWIDTNGSSLDWGGGAGNPPTIVIPSSQNVSTSFTACGYDNPSTTKVTGWVTHEGTTYPGTTLASPSPPYNWAVSFSGLPATVAGHTDTLTIQITGTTYSTTMNIVVGTGIVTAEKKKQGRQYQLK